MWIKPMHIMSQRTKQPQSWTLLLENQLKHQTIIFLHQMKEETPIPEERLKWGDDYKLIDSKIVHVLEMAI